MAFGDPATAADPWAGYRAGFVNPQPPIAQAATKPTGFFGEGGTGRTIAGLIGDALLRMSGSQPIFAPLMASMRERQMEDARAQTQSDRELNREKSLFDYEDARKKPEPTEYERALQAAGVQPGTPEYLQHMKSYLNVRENPPYFYTDPTTGQTMMIPRAVAPGTPAPSGVTFTPMDDGGPTPPASGGFSR